MGGLTGPNPRPNARRLASLVAGVAGLLLAGGLIQYFIGIGDSSSRYHPQAVAATPHNSSSQHAFSGATNLGIAYGTTPDQVLRQLGSPAAKQTNCWLYRGRVIPDSYRALYIDAMKFCFSDGAVGNKVVTRIITHSPTHTITRTDPVTHAVTTTKYPAGWGPPLVLQKVPAWYLQQDS
jgi:hypothetical protein